MDNHVCNLELIQRCDLCGNEETDRLFTAEDHIFGDTFWLVKCRACSFIFTNPRPTQDTIGNYYPDSYYGTNGNRFRFGLENIVHFFRQRLTAKIERLFRHPGRVLEVGSGRGTLLHELHQKGWNAVGTEFAAGLAISTSKHMGVPIIHSPDLVECKFPDSHFDLIICYHVLEHLPDPTRTLSEIQRILQPQGVLIIAVPNFGGWVSQWTNKQWFAIDVPRHLSHFTEATLERALLSTGFTPFQKRTLSLEQDIFGFAQSLLNKAGFEFNVFYDLIRRQNAKLRQGINNHPANPVRLSLIALLGFFLSLVGLPIVVISSVFGKGGTLEYWAHPSHNILESPEK